MEDLFADVLHEECEHGLTKRTCSWCLEKLGWGMFHSRSYRRHLADIFPEKISLAPTSVRYCSQCIRRGANKGNRLNVRLPRERKSFVEGAPVYAPSWSGPLVTRPKVRRATHRIKGKWLCDVCDPSGPVREDVGEAKRTFTARDIFK